MYKVDREYRPFPANIRAFFTGCGSDTRVRSGRFPDVTGRVGSGSGPGQEFSSYHGRTSLWKKSSRVGLGSVGSGSAGFQTIANENSKLSRVGLGRVESKSGGFQTITDEIFKIFTGRVGSGRVESGLGGFQFITDENSKYPGSGWVGSSRVSRCTNSHGPGAVTIARPGPSVTARFDPPP